MKRTLFTLIFLSQAGWAGTPNVTDKWVMADLSKNPQLAAFFNSADALITLKPKPGTDAAAIPDAPKPTVFLYKFKADPKVHLESLKDWHDLVSKLIKDQKRGGATEKLSPSGRYLYEFTMSRGEDSDMQSAYLAFRDKDLVDIFVFDGVGPVAKQNLQLVNELFSQLNPSVLNQLALAGPNKKP